MDVHENARTTRHGRMLMIERLQVGCSVGAVAPALGVTGKTVRNWRDRHAAQGATCLADRSSRPHHSPTRLSGQVEEEIEVLRRQRLTAPAIARPARTPALHHRRGAAPTRPRPLHALDPRPPIPRYERERPGELLHIKKLGRIDGIGHHITGDRTGQSNRRAVGRGLGWEYVHVAVDDASRLAYTELMPDERKESAVAFTAGRSHGSPATASRSSAS